MPLLQIGAKKTQNQREQSILSGSFIWEAVKTQLEGAFYMQVRMLSLVIPPKYAIFWEKKNI